MPLSLTGKCLGFIEKDFDFTDEAGKQVKGTSRKLVILDGLNAIRVSVPEDYRAVVKRFAEDNAEKPVTVPVQAGPRGLSYAPEA